MAPSPRGKMCRVLDDVQKVHPLCEVCRLLVVVVTSTFSPPPKLSRLWAPILGNPHKPVPCFLKHQHLFQYSVIWRSLHRSSTHCGSYVPLESFSVASQVVSRLLIQRIRGVGFQEQKLRLFKSVSWLKSVFRFRQSVKQKSTCGVIPVTPQ